LRVAGIEVHGFISTLTPCESVHPMTIYFKELHSKIETVQEYFPLLL